MEPQAPKVIKVLPVPKVIKVLLAWKALKAPQALKALPDRTEPVFLYWAP
jgi:hypothetical protein